MLGAQLRILTERTPILLMHPGKDRYVCSEEELRRITPYVSQYSVRSQWGLAEEIDAPALFSTDGRVEGVRIG